MKRYITRSFITSVFASLAMNLPSLSNGVDAVPCQYWLSTLHLDEQTGGTFVTWEPVACSSSQQVESLDDGPYERVGSIFCGYWDGDNECGYLARRGTSE